jgi:hypothetical protein
MGGVVGVVVKLVKEVVEQLGLGDKLQFKQ